MRSVVSLLAIGVALTLTTLPAHSARQEKEWNVSPWTDLGAVKETVCHGFKATTGVVLVSATYEQGGTLHSLLRVAALTKAAKARAEAEAAEAVAKKAERAEKGLKPKDYAKATKDARLRADTKWARSRTEDKALKAKSTEVRAREHARRAMEAKGDVARAEVVNCTRALLDGRYSSWTDDPYGLPVTAHFEKARLYTPGATAFCQMDGTGRSRGIASVRVVDPRNHKSVTVQRLVPAPLYPGPERRCDPSHLLTGLYQVGDTWPDLGFCFKRDIVSQGKSGTPALNLRKMLTIGRTVICKAPQTVTHLDAAGVVLRSKDESTQGQILQTASGNDSQPGKVRDWIRQVTVSKTGVPQASRCELKPIKAGSDRTLKGSSELTAGSKINELTCEGGLAFLTYLPIDHYVPPFQDQITQYSRDLQEPAKGATHVEVTLPSHPTSVVNCDLRNPARNISIQMSWDPSALDPLTKRVLVPAAPAGTVGTDTKPCVRGATDYKCRKWRVICTAEPRMRSMKLDGAKGSQGVEVEVDLAWRFSDRGLIGASSDGLYPLQIPRLKIGSDGKFKVANGAVQFAVIRLTANARPSLGDSMANLTATTGQGTPRSLAVALPSAVSELLSVIAEIALERAKTGAFELVRGKLQDAVCDKLKVDRNTPFAQALARDTRQGPGEVKLFPQACRIVTQVRLQELMLQLQQLYQAVLEDVSYLGTAAVNSTATDAAPVHRRLVESLTGQVRTILVGVVRGKSIDPQKEAQMLLVNLARASADLAKEAPTYGSCGLALGFAAIGSCYSQASCDARRLSDMLHNPGRYFKLSESCKPLLKDIFEHWKDLGQLATRGVELLRTPTTTKPLEFLRAVIDFGVDVVAKVMALAGKNSDGLFPTNLGELKNSGQCALPEFTVLKTAWDAAKSAGAKAVETPTSKNISEAAYKVMSLSAALQENCATTTTTDAGVAARKQLLAWKKMLDSSPLLRLGRILNTEECGAAKGKAIEAVVSFVRLMKRPTLKLAKDSLKLSNDTYKAATPKCRRKLEGEFESLSWQSWAHRGDRGIAKLLPPLGQIAEAVLERDLAKGLAAALAFLEAGVHLRPTATVTDDISESLTKLGRVLSAATGYALTYAKDEDATNEELRERRKEAIESVIDSFTERSERYSDWIVSLGIPVGLRAIGMHVHGSDFVATTTNADGSVRTHLQSNQDVSWFGLQLSMPLGFAVQRMPTKSVPVGIHFMLYPIDVGQFLAWDNGIQPDDPEWHAFLSPGFQFGFTVGTPQHSLVFAIDGSYAPLRHTDQGEGFFRIGLTVSYYVPLFDFN